MKLKINEEELELVYSFRSNIYFEQIQGHSLDFTKLTGNDLATLFYCIVIASLQKAKKPIITMLEFLDVVDDNGGDKCLIEFSNWYINMIKAQYEVSSADKEDKEDTNTEVDDSKKKN